MLKRMVGVVVALVAMRSEAKACDFSFDFSYRDGYYGAASSYVVPVCQPVVYSQPVCYRAPVVYRPPAVVVQRRIVSRPVLVRPVSERAVRIQGPRRSVEFVRRRG